MLIRKYTLALAVCASALSAQPAPCNASPEILAEFREAAAASAAVTDSFGALKKAQPFLELCYRHPDDLIVHERYQDAMHENGIEGHLRLLTKQYKTLEDRHPGEPMYHYLWLRTTVGRNTPEAILGLNELLEAHPDFVPAHRTLAEIYGTEAFRDGEKEKSEKEKFLALCPGGAFTKRPPSIPGPSSLIDQAERLLAENGDPNGIVEMTNQGLKEFEWRSQRLRAFDWYSRDHKIQDARQLRDRYWQAWPVQVRCYRKAGRLEKANDLLAYMEQHAVPLGKEASPVYWHALDVLAELYLEGKQSEQARKKLEEMQEFLSKNSDSTQTARAEELRKSIAGLDQAGSQASRMSGGHL
jgi:tetratricopeptide (TPR) repeat protein